MGIRIFEAIAATLFDSIDKMSVGVIKDTLDMLALKLGERAAHA